MKKSVLYLTFLVSIELISRSVPTGNCLRYVSASERIVSSYSWDRSLFQLNVTYPDEAKIGEEFNVHIQLWQSKNTSVSVYIIYIEISQNMSQILLKEQKLENPAQNEILVADKTLRITPQKSQRWCISVEYSVKDLNFGGTWTMSKNDLASFQVIPQTYADLTNQNLSLQNQVSELQTTQWAFIFLTAYLAVTLGIIVPLAQRRRKTSSKQSIFKE